MTRRRLTFYEGLEFFEAFFYFRYVDSGVGQADIKIFFSRQRASKVPAGTERNTGFMQHGAPEILAIRKPFFLHGAGNVREKIKGGIGPEAMDTFN